jgi:CubicO group peptidase (beta-lactamase class C family)
MKVKGCELLMLAMLGGTTSCLGRTIERTPSRLGTPESSVKPLAARVQLINDSFPRLLREGEVPGASIALIEDGRVVWVRGFGVRNAETRLPVTEHTVFEAASLSKPVVAYLALQLVDRKQLDLDAPLATYVASLNASPLGSAEDLRALTARRILTHTSGLPSEPPAAGPLRLQFRPGERFSYSSEGFLYLQQAIEAITGVELDAVAQRLVFEPLGMRSSGFVWRSAYDTLKAHGHDQAGRVTGRRQSPFSNAAASLETTAGDYARFLVAVLTGSGLSEGAAREMLRAQVRVDSACVVCLATSSGVPSSIAWGLGWGLVPQGQRDTSVWHMGDNGDMQAYVTANLRARRGMVMFTNSANGLSIAPELERLAMGTATAAAAAPGLAWAGYERYDAPARHVLRDIIARGDIAVGELKARQAAASGGAAPSAVDSSVRPLTADELTTLGKRLLARERTAQAIAVFTLATQVSPSDAGAHVALADAYGIAGDTASAVRELRRALEILPSDTTIAAALHRFTTPAIGLSPEQAALYVGRYDTPLGELVVSMEGARMVGRLGDQGAATLVAQSTHRFAVEPGRATVEFTDIQGGHATAVVIRAGDKEFRGRRLPRQKLILRSEAPPLTVRRERADVGRR